MSVDADLNLRRTLLNDEAASAGRHVIVCPVFRHMPEASGVAAVSLVLGKHHN